MSAIAVGVFSNYEGGILVRFTLADGESRLLAFSSAKAFNLHDQFNEAMAHFEKHGFVREPVERVLPLPAEDFDNRETDYHVGTWFLNIASDGALWRLVTSRGSDIVLRLSPTQMASLLFEVECAIEHVKLIDLRPYKDMPWTQLTRVLEDHPGFKLAERLRAFDFSIEIFRRNSTALIQHLEKASGPLTLEQVRWDRRFEVSTFLKDAIHLLLNFVAAAKALVEHSRSFYRYHYEPRGKLSHYSEETKRRFANDGPVQFIHKLRDLMLHVGLVGLIHQTKFQPGTIVGRVWMDRDVALVWSGWGAVAKTWLQSGPREVALLETVSAYIAKVEDFQLWYANECERIDWRDLRYAEQLRKATLARRGREEIPELKELLNLPSSEFQSLRQEIGHFLNDEQIFLLRDDEGHPHRWLPKALDIVRDSYYVPLDLCDSLVLHFAPEAPLPSAMPPSTS